MKWTALLAAALSAVAAAAGKPDVEASVKFPASNPFGRVYNGHSNNLLLVHVSNHANDAIVVTRVHGQYREAQGKARPLRNTTSLRVNQPVPANGLPSPVISYAFHSENKIGDVGLRVWIDYLDSKNSLHSLLAFDDTVTVEEPPSSWFDLQLLFLYVLLGSFFSFVAYQLSKSYFAASLRKRSKRAPLPPAAQRVKSPATPVKSLADGQKAYEDDWIPEHHLRSRKSATKGGNATSGDESETTSSKRKGKGRR